MFDIGWSELLLVLVVALVVVGPKDLPRLMRMIGRWVGKARRMADQFRANFDELARETELDELRREIAALRTHNPVTRIQDEINRSIQRSDGIASAPTPVVDTPLGDADSIADHDVAEHPLPPPGPSEPAQAADHAAGAQRPEPSPPGTTPTGL